MQKNVRIVIDANQELSFQFQILLNEADDNIIIIGTARDHKIRKVWTLFIVKVIIEIIDNGTPPSAIANDLESACRLISPSEKIK